MRPYREIPYKTIGGTTLNLRVVEPDAHDRAVARSGIVFFIGSGWVQGNPGTVFPRCSYFASRGTVVCYRHCMECSEFVLDEDMRTSVVN